MICTDPDLLRVSETLISTIVMDIGTIATTTTVALGTVASMVLNVVANEAVTEEEALQD